MYKIQYTISTLSCFSQFDVTNWLFINGRKDGISLFSRPGGEEPPAPASSVKIINPQSRGGAGGLADVVEDALK